MSIDIKDLKARLSRDDVVGILNSVGYVVEVRTFAFCLRDEKTASAIVNTDNSIHDYGSGYHGDVLDVLVKHNHMRLPDAIKLVANYIGISIENYISMPPVERKAIDYRHQTRLENQTYGKMVTFLNHLDVDKHFMNITYKPYEKELFSIVPKWCYYQATLDSMKRFRNYITYDKRNDTLIIKIHDYEGKLISYKRRRFRGNKWMTAKGTHPNNQCMFSNVDDTKNVYIVEGHHDFLTAVLLGINVFMIPTVNYKNFTEFEVKLLQSRDVVFIPDWKRDDLSGMEAMLRLAMQIEDMAYSTRLFSLPKFLKDEGIAFSNDKLDLSEVVELWSVDRVSITATLEFRTKVLVVR